MNGSFETGDFTGWQVSGIPSVSGAPPTPVAGSFQALVNSTGIAGSGVYAFANSVPAATLDTFLNTTLPSNASGVAVNGEAIQQTFTTLRRARLTFSYSYQSREDPNDGRDETGYVLNGTFHVIADTNTPGQTHGAAVGFFVWGVPYRTASITVGPGTNTLSFVTYNTVNTSSPTGLFLDNIFLSPLLGGPHVPTQLTPLSLQVFSNIAFDNATFNTLDVTNHLANLRDGLTGFDGSQLTVSDPNLSPGASQINNRLLDMKDMKDMKDMTPASATVPADRWSTFIAGNVILADLSHDQDLPNQDYTTGSVMLGLDYRLDDHFTVGALVDYAHTDANLDKIGSTATVDTYSAGVYGSYVDGGWYGNGLFTYGYNSYTEDRNVNIEGFNGTNEGAPQGNQYEGNLTGGYEFQRGDFKFGPIAGLQYVNLGINSFSEDGPTALNVQSESVDSLRSQLGVEMRYALRAGSVWLTPHASVTWQHEFLDGSRGITSQFNQGAAGSFTVETTGVDRDSAVIDVGLNAAVAENVTLFVDYQTEAGEDNFFAQSVQAGVKVGF